MGHIEYESERRARNRKIQALILGTVAVAGVLAVAVVAPNVIGGMQKLGMLPKRRQGEYINAARKRLKEEGYLVEEGGFLRLTKHGENHLRSLAISLARPPHLRRWDKRWRVLIFDIPDRKHALRGRVRNQLREAGFVRLQDSVWLYPYPCDDFIALLKSEFRIGKDLLYMIVDSLEGDAPFRKHFGLPALTAGNPEPLPLPKILDMALEPVLPRYDKAIRPKKIT